MRQRVTRGGVAYSVLMVMVGILAFLTGNNLMFLMLASLVAVILVSGFVSRLSLAGLELDVILPEHLPARTSIPARLRLRNEKSWMPSFSIWVKGAAGSVYSSELYFPLLPSGGFVEESVDVRFERRGLHSSDSFLIRSRFPFALAERNVQVTLRREVVVYPCLEPRAEFEPLLEVLDQELLSLLRAQGHDFYRIRPYEHQESARNLDWRASAHTGELQVREYATEREPLVEVFLDLRVPGRASEWFEGAVDCAACLCWRAAGAGARVRFRTQDFDLSVPSEAQVDSVLRYLAVVEPRSFREGIAPGGEIGVRLVLSADPERTVKEGWADAHQFGATMKA